MSIFRKKNQYYSETFKEAVVSRVMKSELSVLEASKEYGIGGSMTLYRWLDKYAPEWRETPEPIIASMSKESEESAAELSAKIESLQKLLAAERLRSEAYLQMIKLAEGRYKISIEKKSGAKRSKS